MFRSNMKNYIVVIITIPLVTASWNGTVLLNRTSHISISILPYSNMSSDVPWGNVFKLYLSRILSPGLFLDQNFLKSNKKLWDWILKFFFCTNPNHKVVQKRCSLAFLFCSLQNYLCQCGDLTDSLFRVSTDHLYFCEWSNFFINVDFFSTKLIYVFSIFQYI